MVSKAAMNGHPIEEATSAVGEHVVNLTSDLISLAELQGQLLVIDMREAGEQAGKPLVIGGVGACVFLGTIPIFLWGIVETLSTHTSLSREAACWIVALTTMSLAVLAVAYALLKIRHAGRVLGRSQAEFRDNLRWIKKVVQQAGLSGRA